jgi:hypothetical protein
MGNQTLQDGKNNRGENKKDEVENQLRPLWLAIMFHVKHSLEHSPQVVAYLT